MGLRDDSKCTLCYEKPENILRLYWNCNKTKIFRGMPVAGHGEVFPGFLFHCRRKSTNLTISWLIDNQIIPRHSWNYFYFWASTWKTHGKLTDENSWTTQENFRTGKNFERRSRNERQVCNLTPRFNSNTAKDSILTHSFNSQDSSVQSLFCHFSFTASDKVGFGLMDAYGLVSLAVNWTTVPPQQNCTKSRHQINRCGFQWSVRDWEG